MATKNDNSVLLSAKALYDDIENTEISVARNNGIGRTFLSVTPNVSVKSEYTDSDYYYFRPGEDPTSCNNKAPIFQSMKAYDKVGIVRNVIDLMADFTCKGIKLIHPNPKQEKFYKQWWNYVNGDQVSERFLNYLYRIANVPVNITYGKVPVRIERQWSSAYGTANDRDEEVKEVKTEYRRVPLRYNFINPLTLEPLAPEITVFTGKPIYGLRLNKMLITAIQRLKERYPSVDEKELMKMMPPEVLEAIRKNENIVPIKEDGIQIYFYKKDDWEIWAKPMVYSIIDDLTLLEKMKLGDMSAMDGAISNVRLWKIGHIGDTPATTIIPNKAMIAKVRNILANNVAGGSIDLVWGPDIDFKESNTQVHNFLGGAKYAPVLSNIYEGLGVPFGSGAGGGSGQQGLTNNFIAMQTFVERLEYGRRVLMDFWTKEIEKVQKAMKYSKPAIVSFDQINLGDDTTYKNLLLSMLDRDIISIDTALDNFNMFADVEKIKIRREHSQRGSGKITPKASPFHNPDNENDMKKIVLQSGNVTPSQMGVKLQPNENGEITPNQQQFEQQSKLADKNNKAKIQQAKYKPRGTNGRPKKKKDSKKRKQKVITSKADFTNLFVWASNAQKKISDTVTPALLEKVFKKPNVRSLSNEEFELLEEIKFTMISNAVPFQEIDMEAIGVLSNKSAPNADIVYLTKALKASYMNKNNREPSADEMRQIQVSAYALCYEEQQDSEKEFDILQVQS